MADVTAAEWIASLKTMAIYLEDHPHLIPLHHHVMLCAGSPDGSDEAEAIFKHLPDEDNTGDPARFFGPHWIYLSKIYKPQNQIDEAVAGLQLIRDDLADD